MSIPHLVMEKLLCTRQSVGAAIPREGDLEHLKDTSWSRRVDEMSGAL